MGPAVTTPRWLAPSVEDLNVLLRQHAYERDGRWYFGSGGVGHSEEEALLIVEACTMLGVTVTDQLTSKAWSAVVGKLRDLDERIFEIERAARVREDYEREMGERG